MILNNLILTVYLFFTPKPIIWTVEQRKFHIHFLNIYVDNMWCRLHRKGLPDTTL